MSDPATTFTIEVMGFPMDSDPEEIAASLAEFFGISIEDGRRLVRRAPVRVKRNASADVTQQLVKQLRKLGADVLVRNEQTGEERTYRPGDGPISQPAPSPAEPDEPEEAPPEDTLESEDVGAPREALPRVEVIVPSQRGGAVADEPPVSGPPVSVSVPLPPRAPSFSQPGEARGRISSQPGDPPRSSDPGARRPGSPAISVPPPSQPIISVPPPSRASLQFCASCKSPVEKGDVCARCGWNNAEKQRHCRQCKKKLALVSGVSRSPVLIGLIAVGSIALGAGALLLFGVIAGLAALAFGLGLGLAADALTLRYACASCTVAVYTERRLKEEEARLASARRKSAAVAIACGLLGGGLLLVPGGSSHKLEASAFGVAWAVEVPSTHAQIGSEVALIQTPKGERRVRVQWAERSLLAGRSYFLMNMPYSSSAGSPESDKAGLQASIEQVVQVVFNGSVTGAVDPKGDSLQAEFAGTFHGKPVFGRVIGTQYETDMVFVALTAGAAQDLRDSGADAYLSSVAVQREGK